MNFFFEFEGTLFQIPVLPSEFTRSFDAEPVKNEVIGLGEVALPKSRNLEEFNIESFLPFFDNYPFITTSGQFAPPNFYIDMFNKIIDMKAPLRFIIPDLEINKLVLITNFEYTYKGGTKDVSYVLTLLEFIDPLSINSIPQTAEGSQEEIFTTSPPLPPEPKKFAVGDVVIANGAYFYDSYGKPPSGSFNNFKGKISHKAPKNPYPVHITGLDGGWFGWLKEDQLTHENNN